MQSEIILSYSSEMNSDAKVVKISAGEEKQLQWWDSSISQNV